jgi:hypothetical protein
VPFAVSEPSLHLGENNLFFTLQLVQYAIGDDLQMGLVADALHQRRHRGLQVDQQIRRRQCTNDQIVELAVGPIVSQVEHLHVVQSAGKDVSILVDAAILDDRVLAGTDVQMGAGTIQGSNDARTRCATLTVAQTCRIMRMVLAEGRRRLRNSSKSASMFKQLYQHETKTEIKTSQNFAGHLRETRLEAQWLPCAVFLTEAGVEP